jgi:chlorobactene glucosyltransferase
MIYYHLAVTVFLLIVTVNIAINWGLFVAPPPLRSDAADLPLVSVLVPARNEARRIVPCLQSLCRQDYPNYEIIVLDDHSEDDTARVVTELGFGREPGSARRLLAGAALPEGWTGKAWACQQLAAAARGSYLLFTDADTLHEPPALGAFVGHAQSTGAGLLSAWPHQVTRTWSERAVIPLVYVLLLGALPHGILIYLQHRPDKARRGRREWLRSLGAANGQYMLFRRDVYELIGGHAAVRAHLVEDVLLGRLVAERTGEGVKLVNCDGSRLVHCRMYESFADLWEGFTKNLRPAFSESQLSFWIFGAVQAAGLFFPFVWVCLPGLSGRWYWLPVLQVIWLYALRAALTARFRTSWLGAWLHPLGHGLSLVIGLNSWRLSARKGVVWKGRVYKMVPGVRLP